MYTEQQLQALRDALANGVRRVRFENREIEYRSIEELKAAIAAAEADVAKASGKPASSRSRCIRMRGSRKGSRSFGDGARGA